MTQRVVHHQGMMRKQDKKNRTASQKIQLGISYAQF
jgi:hypothetical protein